MLMTNELLMTNDQWLMASAVMASKEQRARGFFRRREAPFRNSDFRKTRCLFYRRRPIAHCNCNHKSQAGGPLQLQQAGTGTNSLEGLLTAKEPVQAFAFAVLRFARQY
jgi:hypothetical protein